MMTEFIFCVCVNYPFKADQTPLVRTMKVVRNKINVLPGVISQATVLICHCSTLMNSDLVNDKDLGDPRNFYWYKHWLKLYSDVFVEVYIIFTVY